MNLFYGQTLDEQIRNLKRDIKNWSKTVYGYDFGNRGLTLAIGNKEHIGNNMLIISEPLLSGHKCFCDPNYVFLKKILSKYKLDRIFMTANFIIPLDIITRTDIINYSKFINAFIDIIQPKLIVVTGEKSTFLFFKKKFILRDWHGKVIGKTTHDIQIILTYSPGYYLNRSNFEDASFKDSILHNDWSFITELYSSLIGKTSKN